METFSENNSVKLGGVVASELEVSHEIYGEKFYKFFMEIDRLSGIKDKIPVIISERLIDVNNFEIGKIILVDGQYRSYNQMLDTGKSKLILSVFVKEIETEGLDEKVKTINELVLIGCICKPPIYRKTPLGRDIADILVAVNRAYNKSDYIPCILWGRNAKFCQCLGIGTNVRLEGRIQAREYEKKYEDGTSETRVAYEVSVSKFEEFKAEKIDNE
ncbi:MAG: single-stranded DNA-binding protein [Clostridia bacterium]|nr:single-stranded DNA-binding protein [Clostridia bacterium]